MNNRIDQLFKEKLELHSIPAPANAWSRIEMVLSKKNSIIVWWRLAAVFLLFGLIVSALYWLQSTSEYTQPMLVEKIVAPSVQPAKEKATELVTAKIESVEKKKRKMPRIEKTSAKDERSMTEVNPVPKTEAIAESTPSPAQEAITVVAKTDKPIVLEFTLAPVEFQTVAHTEEKASGLKRVLEKAIDLKNGESTFDLQNFKESLFAHNTRKDKTKNVQQ